MRKPFVSQAVRLEDHTRNVILRVTNQSESDDVTMMLEDSHLATTSFMVLDVTQQRLLRNYLSRLERDN